MSLRSLRQSRQSPIKRYGSSPLFLVGAAVLGFLAQFQWVGDIVLVIFTVIALVRRLPAKIVFTAALWALGVVPIAIFFSNWVVAQNFAAYSFLLLAIGVVFTTIDLKREPSSNA